MWYVADCIYFVTGNDKGKPAFQLILGLISTFLILWVFFYGQKPTSIPSENLHRHLHTWISNIAANLTMFSYGGDITVTHQHHSSLSKKSLLEVQTNRYPTTTKTFNTANVTLQSDISEHSMMAIFLKNWLVINYCLTLTFASNRAEDYFKECCGLVVMAACRSDLVQTTPRWATWWQQQRPVDVHFITYHTNKEEQRNLFTFVRNTITLPLLQVDFTLMVLVLREVSDTNPSSRKWWRRKAPALISNINICSLLIQTCCAHVPHEIGLTSHVEPFNAAFWSYRWSVW